MAKISIVCPECKAKLAIQDTPGIREKVITCPKCKFKAQVSVYMGGASSRGGQGADDESTQLPSFMTPRQSSAVAMLEVTSSSAVYHLNKGHNIIGRQSPTSTATIQIPGDPYMSRQHVDIEVVQSAAGLQYHLHEINSSNILSINGEEIERGDIIMLAIGDVLTLGQTNVRLVEGREEDSDSTRIL